MSPTPLPEPGLTGVQSVGPKNSFVSFRDDFHVTNSGCVNEPTVCYPIRNGKDLRFQMFVLDDILQREPDIQVFTKKGNDFILVNNFDIEVTQYPNYNVVNLSFENSNLAAFYNDGDCFTLMVRIDVEGLVNDYNSRECFTKIADTCFTMRVTYYNVNEDAFGFHYFGNFQNRIRLPIYLRNPIINTEQEVYLRSNGTRQKLFARLSRQYQAITDVMDERMHECLVVAMNHDKVFLSESGFASETFEVTFENEYNNQFPSMMLPVSQWPADFIVYETPFDELNTNCG